MDITPLALYPLAAALVVVMAQYAYTRAQIIEKPDEEGKLWLNYRNFLYVLSVVLVVAAFAGYYSMSSSLVPQQ